MTKKFNTLSWTGTILLIASSLLTSVSLVAEANTVNTKAAYPKSFVDEYMKKCIRQSVKEGLAGEDAQKVCSCTITRFQARYSLTEFQNMTRAADNGNGAAVETLREVGYACFDDILYEQ